MVLPKEVEDVYCNMLSDVLKQKYGCKVYKLSVTGGETCPNRDGSCSTGGCIFCAEGSGGFAANNGDVNEQLDKAKARVKDKFSGDKFIAYFQSYTATYLPPEILYEKLMTAAKRDDIVAISVATRPDCLDDEVMSVLSKAVAVKPLTVELGLQTASDKTADLINRGYKTECYVDACKKLRAIGSEIVAHVIIGLPDETREDMLSTIELVSKTADGIKLQLLHVLKGTRLCQMYEKGEYVPLTIENYVNLLCDCITHLDRRIVINRLTGDGDKRLLVAPMWSADKKRVYNYIQARFNERNIEQGSECAVKT